MPFPASDRVIYRNNPLVEVVCQLRFPPILKISANIPSEFQERVRGVYPLFESAAFPQVPPPLQDLLSKVGGGFAGPTAQIYSFKTSSGTRSISLAQDFAAVSETNYSRWESFYGEVDRTCTALTEEYNPSFFVRTGLRYVNVIDRVRLGLRDVSFSELLNPCLASLLADNSIAPDITSCGAEWVLRLSNVTDGYVRLRHGYFLENDAPNPDKYVIDSDFFTETRKDINELPNILLEFNRISGNLFRWAITKKLADALQPEPIG